MKKIFAVGDIHGCLTRLRDLMSRIEMDDENDTLVFIGDYIDRGKSSREVVDYVLELKNTHKKCGLSARQSRTDVHELSRRKR